MIELQRCAGALTLHMHTCARAPGRTLVTPHMPTSLADGPPHRRVVQ
jgi:hypothetical protein